MREKEFSCMSKVVLGWCRCIQRGFKYQQVAKLPLDDGSVLFWRPTDQLVLFDSWAPLNAPAQATVPAQSCCWAYSGHGFSTILEQC